MTPSMLFALGFVFMFTIGGLIYHLALPLKITICWKLLTIIILGINICASFVFTPVKIDNFEQSAGNPTKPWHRHSLLVGTSETKRDPLITNKGRYSPCNKNSLIKPFPLNNHLSNRFHNKAKTNIRTYSTSVVKLQDNINDLSYLTKYINFKQDKATILIQEKDKSGVYLLINKINGHCYVGSSINLASRMKNYLSSSFLKSRQNTNIPIVKALLKYGQSNFKLLIIEHAEAHCLTMRETYFITRVIPYYNVLKQGYSSLGYKHTEETKKLLSELAKNRVHSAATKSLIAKALTGENNPFYNKSHSMESKIRMIEARSSYAVYVYNSFKQLLVIFPSVLTLGKLIKSNHTTIVNVIQEQTMFRGEWYISNIPYNVNDTPLITT